MQEMNATKLAVELLEQGKTMEDVMQICQMPSLGKYLFEFICKAGWSVEATAEFADMNKTSLYRILNGETRKPQRNVLLRLARVLRMNVDETQQLLKCGDNATLSGSRPRDIVIMGGIVNDMDLYDLDKSLTDCGLLGLLTKG